MNKAHQHGFWTALCCLGLASCQKEAIEPITGRWQILSIAPVDSKQLATLGPMEAVALAKVSQAMRPTCINISAKKLTLVTQDSDSTSLSYTALGSQQGVTRLQTSKGECRIDRIGESRASLTIAGAVYELSQQGQ